MKEEYVSYECAVKLKELGFDWECDHSYLHKAIDKSGNPYLYHVEMRNWNNFNSEVECFSAPRLDQAQKWLREEGIFLMIDPRFFQGDALKDVKWCFIIQPLDDIGGQYRSELYGRLFDSYESALSAGIDKALKFLTIKSNGKWK